MKKMKRILISLLALLLCVMMVASCDVKEDDQPNGTQKPVEPGTTYVVDDALDSELSGPGGNSAFGGDGDNGEGFPKTVDLDIFSATGISGYTIVYPTRGDEWDKTAAYNFQKAIEAVTGVKLPIKNDLEMEEEPDTLRKPKEILIGRARADAYTVPDSCKDYGSGYAAFVAPDERLVVLAGSETGMYFALRDFLYQYYEQDLETVENKSIDKLNRVTGSDVALHIESDWIGTRSINSKYLPYLDYDLSEYQIVYDGTYLQKRMAYILYEGVRSATGLRLNMVRAVEADPNKPSITLEMVAREADAGNPSAAWVAPGEFQMEVGKSSFAVQASNYYGIAAAAASFGQKINAYGFYDYKGEANETVDGDYLGIATGKRESNKYANARAGEHRVMFYNVLFHGSYNGQGSDPSYTFPTGERNIAQSLMIAEYMPDVLGCQEFHRDKRDQSSAVAGHTGTTDLVQLLSNLGYVEAVDPRVKNAYRSSEDIPGTDNGAVTGLYEGDEIDREQISGVPIKGYGGGEKVKVGGDEFYTYWNHTPLFYNQNTTKLIHAEYYWYKYQWDMRTGVGAPGHENGAADAGSKSLTWGVFESIDGGDRYVVISTHMCTRSDYIRWLQGREVLALVEEIKAQYDYPIFFGGDFNGNYVANNKTGSSNIQHFENAGYTSIQDNKTATFTSQMRASHGYPDFDSSLSMVTPGGHGEASCGSIDSGADSIDKIYAINYQNKNVGFNVFGVVIDDCSLIGSDHLPIFLDFDIN